MKSKFEETDYKKLYQLGKKHMPLAICGSKFTMTNNKFLDVYNLDEKAIISYESGWTDGYEEKLDRVEEASSNGDMKATQYQLNELASTKEQVKKSSDATVVEKKVVKKKSGLDHLTNPNILKEKLK